MINCPNCGAQLPDDSSFCTNCGVPLEISFQCSNCGGEVQENDVFCVHCGASFTPENADVNANANINPNVNANVKPAKKEKSAEGGKKSKLPIIIAAAAVGVALIVLGIIFITKLLGGKSKGKDLAVYVKEKEITFSNLTDKAGVEVSKSFVESGVGADSIRNKESDISRAVRVSNDGKLLFYPDKSEASYLDDYYPLFFCETDNPSETQEKIDNNVVGYKLSENADIVTYRKNDGALCQYDVRNKEKNKIASDITGYCASDDGKKLVFIETKDDSKKLYYMAAGADKVKIDNDIYSLSSVSKDFKKIYYTKNNTLYRYTVEDENKEKIAGDVAGVWQVYDSGEIYYVTKDGDNDDSVYYDYIESNFTIWYYDGKESEKLGEFYEYGYYYGIYNSSSSDSVPILIYSENDENDKDSREYFIAVGKNKTSIGDDKITGIRVNDEGTYVYYLVLDEDDDNKTGELFRVRIEGEKAGKPESYDKEVYNSYIYAYDGENISYFKDINSNNSAGELYFNKTKVQYDVYLYLTDYDEDSKKLYYIADYDSKNYSGKLEVYAGEKAQKISDDVQYNYIITPQSNVLYLKDYSTKSFTGDLYSFDGESRKIDEDVIALLNPWN